MPSKTEKLTNEQFMRKLMAGELTQNLHFGLVQVFVIDALSKWSEHVAATTVTDYPASSVVNPEAWIATATAIKEALDKQFSN